MHNLLNINIFKEEKSIAHRYILEYSYPWEVVGEIPKIVSNVILNLGSDFEEIAEDVYAFRGTLIPKTATIIGPTVIDKCAEIRPGAYVRGNAIIGKGTVIGNSCEIKNAIIYDGAQIPHFNYVGNSILGYKAHLGAGAIISNLKADKSSAFVSYNGKKTDTGLRKFGAILGDYAEIGCGSVLNPGTIVLPNSNIYPLNSVRGVVPPNSIYKSPRDIVTKQKRG